MKKFAAVIILATILFTFGAPSVFAVDWIPLVSCGRADQAGTPQATCKPCDLLKLLRNLIFFVTMGIVPVVGGILFIWGGILMITSGASPGNFEKGKGIFTNTIYAVAVIFLAFVITNTIIVNLGTNVTGSWWQFDCVNPVDTAPLAPISVPQSDLCGQPAALAGKYSEQAMLPSGKNSPALTALIACISADPEVARLMNPANTYTFERDNPLCNLTRGFPVCGRCAHGSAGSCHYGGRTGTQGSEAADFNAKSGASEYQLFQAIVKTKSTCNPKFINFEGDHTHVSTRQCDLDGIGVSP